jgi:DNA invertase Pin-like site-specific DNA recombinase
VRVGDGSRVIGYCRVSTSEQHVSGLGLRAQRDAIRAECDRRGWKLLRIEEDVSSGAKRGRPGLDAAVEAVAMGEADGLIVAKLDRLSRSVAQFANLLERFRARGWALIILDIGIDTTTVMGEAMATMAATFAQVERRRIGERTRDALAVRKAQGVRLGRPQSISPKLARRIRTMRNRGLTLQAICDKLNNEGVPTPRGGSVWRPTSLRAVLRTR